MHTENSAILAMDGYFHRHSWFWLNPWLDRISFSCRLHCSAQTCVVRGIPNDWVAVSLVVGAFDQYKP